MQLNFIPFRVHIFIFVVVVIRTTFTTTHRIYVHHVPILNCVIYIYPKKRKYLSYAIKINDISMVGQVLWPQSLVWYSISAVFCGAPHYRMMMGPIHARRTWNNCTFPYRPHHSVHASVTVCVDTKLDCVLCVCGFVFVKYVSMLCLASNNGH